MKFEDCKPGVWVTKGGAIGPVVRTVGSVIQAPLYTVIDGRPTIGGDHLHQPEDLKPAISEQVDAHFAAITLWHLKEKGRRKAEAIEWRKQLAAYDWPALDLDVVRAIAVQLGWNTEDGD